MKLKGDWLKPECTVIDVGPTYASTATSGIFIHYYHIIHQMKEIKRQLQIMKPYKLQLQNQNHLKRLKM